MSNSRASKAGSLSELTFRVVIISIILTIILAVSNAYLALKLGILPSASIPAAILSMGILRFFKNSTLLENNLIQTAASAGEAVAGGIVYTIPALIIIHYWFHFSYWENFCFAFLGGVLGVLLSIPLRRFLVTDKHLPFPEGTAIAEVLKLSENNKQNFLHMVQGSILGGFIQLCQSGFNVIGTQWQLWRTAGQHVFGFSVGFSSTLIAAGYLIGLDVVFSIFIGAILSWIIGVPVISQFFPDVVQQASSAQDAANILWSTKLRYIAIGTMLTAGIGLIFSLSRVFWKNMRVSVKDWQKKSVLVVNVHVDKDIPWRWNFIGILIALGALMIFFMQIFPFETLHLNTQETTHILVIVCLYICIIGFIFSIITGYFSGLVGVSASPGSSVIIAGMLLISFILMTFLSSDTWTKDQMISAEAIAIMVGAVITSIACIANDNIQDLKVGYLLNASPWKQQVMLLLGVLIASFVIPPVMQVLFDVYGIADVLPHAGMDPAQALPAPPAAMMAGLTEAVFNRDIPWSFLFIGFCVAVLGFVVKKLTQKSKYSLSVLGLGMGMYLPLPSSIALFVGGCIAYRMKKAKEKGVLLACGLLAGSALMDVILAIPFALSSSPNVLNLAGSGMFWKIASPLFGVGIWVLLAFVFKQLEKKNEA